MEVNRTNSQTRTSSQTSQELTVSTKSTGGGGTRGKRRSQGQARKGRKRKSVNGCVSVDCDGESQASVDKENTPESTQVSVTSMEDSCGTKFLGKRMFLSDIKAQF